MLGFLGKYNDLGNYPKSQSPQKCSERHTGKVTDAGTKAEGKTGTIYINMSHTRVIRRTQLGNDTQVKIIKEIDNSNSN